MMFRGKTSKTLQLPYKENANILLSECKSLFDTKHEKFGI